MSARAEAVLFCAASGQSLRDTIASLYGADAPVELATMSRELDNLFSALKPAREFIFGKFIHKKGAGNVLLPADTVYEAVALTFTEIENAVTIGDVTYLKQIMSIQEALNSIHAAGVAIFSVYVPVLRASQLALDAYHEERRKPNADADVLDADLMDLLAAHRNALPAVLPVIKRITPYGFGMQPVPGRVEEQMGTGDCSDVFPAATISAVADNFADASAELSTQAELRSKTWGKTI